MEIQPVRARAPGSDSPELLVKQTESRYRFLCLKLIQHALYLDFDIKMMVTLQLQYQRLESPHHHSIKLIKDRLLLNLHYFG